jgi:EmrB/QacA subfamily drug resistance transporter
MDENRTTKRAALIVATLSSFIGPFMGSSVNVALPSIGQDYSMGAVLLGWVNTAYLLAAATFLVPFGRLGDIYGRKKIYMWGVLIFTCSSVLIANSGSGVAMILIRVFQGFGASMIFATGMPILISVFPVGERGKALGITVAAVYLGLSVGPFLGGIITQQLGWRYIFWLNLPLGLLLLMIIFFMLKGDWAEAKGAKFDFVGSVILAAALLATMYGFTNLPSLFAIILIIIGLIGMTLFVVFESRIQNPVIDINLFRHNTVFAFSNLAALINYAATFAVGFLLSLYLQRLKGLSPQEAGLVLVSQPIIQAIFSPMAGRLSDKTEPRTVASLGMTLTLKIYYCLPDSVGFRLRSFFLSQHQCHYEFGGKTIFRRGRGHGKYHAAGGYDVFHGDDDSGPASGRFRHHPGKSRSIRQQRQNRLRGICRYVLRRNFRLPGKRKTQ